MVYNHRVPDIQFSGQNCERANNPNGLPSFMDYRGSDLRPESIPELHQAIIPSYRFTCCGNITEWGVDVHPAGKKHDRVYNLDLQVWRPSPTVQTSGCYSLVGNNRFTSVSLAHQVAVVTPLPQQQIEFQPGDVLGFMLENTDGNDGGVVLLVDSPKQEGGYETEEVWLADFSNPVFNNGPCHLAVGSEPGRQLNTVTSAAPVISVSYSKLINTCIVFFMHNVYRRWTIAVWQSAFAATKSISANILIHVWRSLAELKSANTFDCVIYSFVCLLLL